VWIFAGHYGSTAAIQGMRIDGGDAAPLADYNVDQIRAGGLLGEDEEPTPAQVGGKQVGTVQYFDNTVYLYTQGDTAWMVTATSESAAAELLAALP
jgi:hypothetical protein